jgi:acyl-coenzyme A thioesterase PaaI-like protein
VAVVADDQQARHDAASALRELNHRFVGHHRGVDGLRELEAIAKREAAAMRAGDVRDRVAMSEAWVRSPGEVDSSFEDRAVACRSNPTGAAIELARHEDHVVASFVLGPADSGFPGRAHGGVVCGLFDEVTGHALEHLAGRQAFTGEITVRYVAPVPLGEPLTITSRLEGHEGRKIFLSQELRAGDQVVATCRATCITPVAPKNGG